MLFKRAILDRIAAGSITLAFRRWRRPTVRAGSRLRTPLGVLAIEAVDPILVATITEDDAVRAGFPTRAALLAGMGGICAQDGYQLYRVSLRLAGPDARVALRGDAAPTDDAFAALCRSLARLDRASRHGAWTWSTLALIDANPGVKAADLAGRVGRDVAALKRDIRKLKELGLTESLAIGYRLAARGRACLSRHSPIVGAENEN